MKLNGWQRLWIVASVIWCASYLWYAVSDARKSSVDVDLTFLALSLLLATVPAVLIYGAGLVIRWIWRGFKPN